MPQGKALQRDLPKGVMNVVNKDDSFVEGICQNPQLKPSFVKITEPDS